MKTPSLASRAALGALFMAVVSTLPGCLDFHEGPLPEEPKTTSFGAPTFKKIDGARIRYIDVGAGPPVVMIHGFASTFESFTEVIHTLEKDHRVIAMDLKGFGWSDRPEGDYSPKAQAKIVFGLMDQLGVDHAALVAHSWGSSIALQMALDAPKRVDRIALYDAWVYQEQIPTFFLWAQIDGMGEAMFSMFYDERPDEKLALAFYDKKYVTEELVEASERSLGRPGTTAAALAAVRGQDYTEVQKKYPTIEAPTLLLWGRDDKVTTLDFGERLSKELPNARLVVYPQCGHFPFIEARAASTRELVKFLAEPAEKPAQPDEKTARPSESTAPTDASPADPKTDPKTPDSKAPGAK